MYIDGSILDNRPHWYPLRKLNAAAAADVFPHPGGNDRQSRSGGGGGGGSERPDRGRRRSPSGRRGTGEGEGGGGRGVSTGGGAGGSLSRRRSSSPPPTRTAANDLGSTGHEGKGRDDHDRVLTRSEDTTTNAQNNDRSTKEGQLTRQYVSGSNTSVKVLTRPIYTRSTYSRVISA